jgi:5'-nucleotidase
MAERPFLLLVNDDGIHAPGMRHLWEGLAEHADLAIVAPATEQSGTGMSLTLRQPLHIESVTWEGETPAWKVTGTPADCVRMALAVLLERMPDMIVSGINKGSNAGRNILHSGTVGGVIEGALRGIPGVAFSCDRFDSPPYAAAVPHIYPVVRHFLRHPLPRGSLLNVTIPDVVKGYRLARQGMGYWIEDPDERIHPEGMPYYWLGGKWHHHEEEEDSDVSLLREGYMTAVPIHVGELTDHALLRQHRERFSALFAE